MARRPAPSGYQASDEVLEALRARVRTEAADRPGVYRLLGPDGEILYVGKSKRVRSRLLSYFRCDFPEDKGARLLREAANLDWEYTPSEFAALLREMRLIKTHRPRFNVALKRDARHYAFIKLAGRIAPRLVVVRGPAGDDAAVYYGPFVGARALEESLRELSDIFGLRDCSLDKAMHFSDQQELFPLPARTPGCIRYEIGKCLGPCIGACSAHAYRERVLHARAFLEGADDAPMERLRAEMEAAADRLEFERAGSLRDKLERLEHLRAQFERLRFAIEELSFAYTVKGVDGDDRVYLIRHGLVRAELAKPQTRAQRRELKALTESVFAPEPARAAGTVPTHEIDELLLLSYWFRKFPSELKRARPPVEGRRTSGVSSA